MLRIPNEFWSMLLLLLRLLVLLSISHEFGKTITIQKNNKILQINKDARRLRSKWCSWLTTHVCSLCQAGHTYRYIIEVAL